VAEQITAAKQQLAPDLLAFILAEFQALRLRQ
jgi:hypothetical protein